MTVDDELVAALAAALDNPSRDGIPVAEVRERMIAASFKAFLLEFRKTVGRPMSASEHDLTRIAHEEGWLDGFGLAARLARVVLEEEPGA